MEEFTDLTEQILCIEIIEPDPTSRLLKFRHPDIFRQIVRHMTPDVDFDKLMFGTAKKLWWKCENSGICSCHVWESTVNKRTQGRGCPYCCVARKQTCEHTTSAITK